MAASPVASVSAPCPAVTRRRSLLGRPFPPISTHQETAEPLRPNFHVTLPHPSPHCLSQPPALHLCVNLAHPALWNGRSLTCPISLCESHEGAFYFISISLAALYMVTGWQSELNLGQCGMSIGMWGWLGCSFGITGIHMLGAPLLAQFPAPALE